MEKTNLEKKLTTFVADVEAAGFKVDHDYAGGFHYQGPAVRIEAGELQEVVRATAIKFQWDTLGRSDLVVYPK